MSKIFGALRCDKAGARSAMLSCSSLAESYNCRCSRIPSGLSSPGQAPNVSYVREDAETEGELCEAPYGHMTPGACLLQSETGGTTGYKLLQVFPCGIKGRGGLETRLPLL